VGIMLPDLQQTLDVLVRHKSEFAEHYGVTTLGLFGSIAKGTGSEQSDIDVVVTLKEADLFALAHIKETLEQALGRKVDVIHYRDRMNAFLKQRIQQETIYV
jgi:predicted nucleotidyltransferase